MHPVCPFFLGFCPTCLLIGHIPKEVGHPRSRLFEVRSGPHHKQDYGILLSMLGSCDLWKQPRAAVSEYM